MIERKDYIDWYATKIEHKGWCKISATISKPLYGLNWYKICIVYDMEDGTQYRYNLSSPLGGDDAKEFVNSIILNFKPELVPTLKIPEPEINRYEDGAIIKYEDRENKHEILVRVDGKKYSFIRVSNIQDYGCLKLDYSKKIKLKKIENKDEHFQLGMKEWENFNLYIPQIERILNKFVILRDIKEKVTNNRSYDIDYVDIDEKIDDYSCYILKETLDYFDNNDYSKIPNTNITTEEQKLANKLKYYLPLLGYSQNNTTEFNYKYSININLDNNSKSGNKSDDEKKGFNWEWIYCKGKDRIDRKQFGLRMLYMIILIIMLFRIQGSFPEDSHMKSFLYFICILSVLLSFIVLLILSRKRLHDLGTTGRRLLFFFFPPGFFILLLILLFAKGK